MAIHLVRHATAGSRPDWHQPDDLRPLTDRGLVQASTIAKALADAGVTRILSSWYVRCMQTVQPLADALEIEIEQHASLAEEATPRDAWALFKDVAAAGDEAVFCSHGNIIPPLVDRLHKRGIELVGNGDWTCHKGSIWTIELERGKAIRAVQTLARA